jgi:hypothetical protein
VTNGGAWSWNGDDDAPSAGEVRIYTIAGGRDAERAVRAEVLAECLGVPVSEIAIERGDKGKPLLITDPTLYFSVSHSDDVSMIAVTRVAPIGIDVERVRPVPRAEAILRRFFPNEDIGAILSSDDRELWFARAWTRAEATVKVRGASVWEAATPDPGVCVQMIDAPEGYVAAVAVAAEVWDVTRFDYPGEWAGTLFA